MNRKTAYAEFKCTQSIAGMTPEDICAVAFFMGFAAGQRESARERAVELHAWNTERLARTDLDLPEVRA